MASTLKMEYLVFLCILQKNSAMTTLGLKEMGKFLLEGREKVWYYEKWVGPLFILDDLLKRHESAKKTWHNSGQRGMHQPRMNASRQKRVVSGQKRCVSRPKRYGSWQKGHASEQKICAQPKSLEFMHHTMIFL